MDWFYKIIEHWSSKLNVWSWNKRWCNRKQGSSYKKMIGSKDIENGKENKKDKERTR